MCWGNALSQRVVVAQVTLEGRAGTRLEPSRAGLGRAWGRTGEDWAEVEGSGRGWGRTGARAEGSPGLAVPLRLPLAAVEAGVGPCHAAKPVSSATAFWGAWGC